jgi:hypothetical protein
MKTLWTLEHLRGISVSVSLTGADVWNDIHACIRKIDISKQLLDRYQHNWKADPGARALTAAELEMFCTIWNALLERCISNQDISTGRKLKLINSGLKVLDFPNISSAGEHPLKQTFRDYAASLVHD